MPNVFEREEQQAMDELEHVIEEIAAELVGDVEGVASVQKSKSKKRRK